MRADVGIEITINMISPSEAVWQDICELRFQIKRKNI